MTAALTSQWQACLKSVATEYAALDRAEQDWISSQLACIDRLQRQLDALFRRGNGPVYCRNCQGACCDRGKNHFTLVNLLSFLNTGEEPPFADFSRPCPFLGPGGCRLAVERRPFTCITFICEGILDSLGEAGYDEFRQLEEELRSRYLKFDRRYLGSSLHGLLIRSASLAGRPFLRLPSAQLDR